MNKVCVSPVLDANVLAGRYPFRVMASGSAGQASEALGKLGIQGGVISSLDAVFAEDAYECELSLSRDLAEFPNYSHFVSLNPANPWWEKHIARCIDTLNISGIRLFSLYHPYDLESGEASTVFEFASENDLPISITCRMQDARLQRLFPVTEVTDREIEYVIDKYASQHVLFTGLSYATILRHADAMNGTAAMFADTSRLQGPWRTMEKIFEKLDESRLVFGSLWPICLPHCPAAQIAFSDIEVSLKNAVMGENLAIFLGNKQTVKGE